MTLNAEQIDICIVASTRSRRKTNPGMKRRAIYCDRCIRAGYYIIKISNAYAAPAIKLFHYKKNLLRAT